MYRDELAATMAERDHLKTENHFAQQRIEELEKLNEAHVEQIRDLQSFRKAEIWDRAKPWFILVPLLIGAFVLTVVIGVREHRGENVKANQRCVDLLKTALRESKAFNVRLGALRARIKFLETRYGQLIE